MTPLDHPPATERRAVVLVANPAAPYSRGLRIARALVAEGYAVEIAAVAIPGLPDQEWDGPIEIRRYRPSGPLASMAPSHAGTIAAAREGSARGSGGPTAIPPAAPAQGAPQAPPTPPVPAAPAGTLPQAPPAPPAAPPTTAGGWSVRRIARLPRLVAGRIKRRSAAVARWLLWPHTVRAWWRTLGRELAPADLYHACGSLTIAPAIAARDRTRRTGRRAVVVYDAIDDVFESNNVLDMPAPLRAWNAGRERRWARAADARTTVNDALADRLAGRWSVAERPVVVPNYPEQVVPDAVPGTGGDRIRHELGLPPETRIVLFQGRLGPNLGLDEAAEAVLLVPDAVLVLIGFGRSVARSQARDAAPRFRGRHFTLPARHPDELAAWTASADVSVVPLPPISFNQRHATPNKFWESLAVGTPVVVGPDLPVMDDLVHRLDLGVVARSLGADDLAVAIRAVIDRPPGERAAWRAAIRATSAERFSWSAAATAYRQLVRAISGRDG